MKQRRFAGFGATVGVLTLVSTLLAPAAAHADGETITELFPRTPVAAYVASELNLAVTDVPTSEQLESITQFALRGSTLESLEELAPLTGLTRIDVRDNKLTTLAGAAAFPALDELVVMSNRITDVSGLAGSGLSEFWGGFNPFESGFEVFAGLSNLKLVEARAARIDDAKFAQIVQAPVLSDLNFNTTESSAEFRNTITSIEPVLQRLTIEAMSFNGNLGLTSIEGISQLTSLRNLGLSSTAVYDFSELVQGAFPVQLAHMENHDVLRIKAGEGTVTYTHPVRDMQLTGIPSRQPVVDSFVPFGGVTSWNPASLELTITWNAAELAKKDELVYTHTLFNSTGTKYLEGIMTLALEHEYSVDFDLAGGTGDFPAQIVVGGDTATQPDTTPTRDGYTFTNWVTEAGITYDFTTPITTNTTIYADWTQNPAAEYQVTFDLTGGTGDFPAQIVVGGDTATQPDTTPTRDGYTFTNWVTEAGITYDFTTPITTNTTIYADWTQQSGPVVPPTETVDPPKKTVKPPKLPVTGGGEQQVMLGLAAGSILLLGSVVLVARRLSNRGSGA